MLEHEHIFGRIKGSSNPWLCLDCKVEDTRTEIEFVQDEVNKEQKRIIKLLSNYINFDGKFNADAADIIAHIKRDGE
jgi:hypothetical protein